MRIDFLGLQAFLAIAQRGSFQQAAAHLNLSQTALSHRIRKLEDDLGVRLLSRTTREVSLTPAGLELLPKVRDMIDGLGASLLELRQGGNVRQQRIAIGCLPTIAAGRLPAALRAFRNAHPDVNVRVYDNSATEIAEHVDTGAIEFGITLVAAHRWDFDIELLAREPFVLVCQDDHPLAAQASVSWTDIEDSPLVRVSPHTGNRMMIDDALGSRRENLNWAYEVQHIGTAVAFVRAGLAMTVVPELALDSFKLAGLKAIALRNPGVVRQIGIVSKRSSPLSPLGDELRRFVVRAFATPANELGLAAS
ncbi:LysR family transcriptional regulator [Terrarubrum flagellatum]|uniref:LysR family transcriptional regulator n=1 Tax=Terrirubrum flagellatum TaxID=2895980 RepID=UPI00314518D3